MVQSAAISFEQTSASMSSIDVSVLDRAGAGSLSVTPSSSTEFAISVKDPVVLGVRQRTLLAGSDDVLDITARMGKKNQDLEPNEDRASAAFLGANGSVKGSVGLGDDAEDWYAIVPEHDGVLAISVRNTTDKGTKGADLDRVRVYGPNNLAQQFHGSRIPVGRSNDHQLPVAAGEIYWIRVAAQENEGAWYYISTSLRDR